MDPALGHSQWQISSPGPGKIVGRAVNYLEEFEKIESCCKRCVLRKVLKSYDGKSNVFSNVMAENLSNEQILN